MKKKPDPPKSFPLWQSTFSDLMNLLLCFFVLLFSMSSINEDKYQMVVNSLQTAFTSIMAVGGSTIVQGNLVSSGITQLPDFSDYLGNSLSKGDADGDTDTGTIQRTDDSNSSDSEDSSSSSAETQSVDDAEAEVDKAAMQESEKMAEDIEAMTTEYGIQDMVEVDFNGDSVTITLSGALLFDSGSAELRSEAQPLIEKLANILNNYPSNLINVEGHTDNVPIHSSKFESNDVLSMYRALDVANLIRDNSTLDPGHITSTGRGAYDPVADNSTPEGRARNRRVEIKVYNSYNSGSISDGQQ